MNRPLLLGAGGIVVAVVAAAAIVRDHDRSSPPAPGVATAPPPSAVAPAPPPAGTQAAAQPAAPPTASADAQPKSEPAKPGDAANPVAPSFDVVRIGPTGAAVFAGRAAPESRVTVLDGNRSIGEALADRRGEWVLVPDKALPPGNRSLSLSAETPGSGTSVASNGDVLVAVPEPHRDIAGRSADEGATALALLVPHAGGDVARPLQVPAPSPATSGPASGKSADTAGVAGAGGLGVDVVEYDSSGRLGLAGHAAPGSELNLYLDDKLIGQVKAGSDGRWSAKPEGDVPAGLYQLRVDQLGGNGKVASRVAMPFQRAETAATDMAENDRFTVQPGNSLWRIARKSYGSGLRYAVIYGANRDQIADPDRIYPGQVFRLPQTN